MTLSDWAVRNFKPLIFLTLILSLTGAFLYRTFPVSILPDVTFPRVVVIAEAGDQPEKRVDVSITRPLEDVLATVPAVSRIRSKTKRGSTEISVDFAPGTDIMTAEQLVNAKVNQVRPELPLETRTEVERMNPTVFPVFGLALRSQSLTQTELWSLATYTLRPRLARVTGVARVVVQGGREPEVEVVVRPEALAAAGLAVADVSQAIAASTQVHAVGKLNQNYLRYQVTVTGEPASVDAIGEIVVSSRNGETIRVRQLAEVRPAAADRETVVSANEADSVLLNVIRQPTANSVSMVEAIQAELRTLRRELPSDVEIGTFYDQSILIKEAVGSVRDAVLLGALLSVVVLLLFLRDIRATLVTAAIIPVTLLITFILMRLAGLTLNLMTLGALAVGIGLVVDDAIVVVESVFRNLGDSTSLAEAVRKASIQIAAPMVSSTLTTVVVFLPLAFLEGVAGAFFSALAITLSIALMVSLALALLVSPSLCAAFLRKSSAAHEDGQFFKAVSRRYSRLLRGLVARRWIVLPIAALTLAGTYGLASRLETGFMPAMDEGSFVLDYLTPPGTSLEESDRLLKKVDRILSRTPEVSTFSRRTGTELGFAITESNRGDYAVMLKTERKRDIEAVIASIRVQVQSEIPGLDVEFIQVLQDLIGDLAGNPEPIEIRLFGENRKEIESLAEDVAARLAKEKGLADVQSGVIESGPEVELNLDPLKVGRLGLTTEWVTSQAAAALAGTISGQLVTRDRQIPIRVRLPLANRNDLESVRRIGIQSGSGRVRLGDLGDLKLIAGTTQSAREDQRRLVSVTARLEGVDLGTAIGAVRKVVRETKFPPGVTAVIAGQFQSQQESFQNLLVVLGTAVLLVFVVMLFQFQSFMPPLVILCLMPLSTFGAVVGLALTHTALNVSSFMGIIMLAGIVVKNGILLLDRAQVAVAEGIPAAEAVMVAGEQRLRPILMTTLTAILGLAPLAFGIGAGSEMQKPLAVAVIGGLAFSTLLTLLIGPVLYVSVTRSRPTERV